MTHDGWKICRLSECADRITSGGTPKIGRVDYYGGDIPFLKIDDLTKNRGLYLKSANASITDKALEETAVKLYPANTVLVTMYGTIGAVAITAVPMAANQAIGAILGLKGVATDFLAYLLSREAPALARKAGQTTQANISGRILKNHKVLLPPLEEQRKIAAILSSVDDAIEKTQSVINQVQVVKRGLMQELLTRGLSGRHTQFKQTELGEIPEEWGIVRIIDVADVDYGISAAVSSNTDPDIGWPILTGANLTLDGQIDLFKLVYHEPPSKERFQLRKNDLLLNWRSGSPKHVGKTALFDLEGNYTYASFVLRIRSKGKLVPGFGHVLLNFMRNAEFFSKDLSQQVNFKMNAAVFREILIRLPSVGEQEEIALTAARFDSRLASEAQSLAALQKVKAALMSVLLTGELRVTLDTETK